MPVDCVELAACAWKRDVRLRGCLFLVPRGLRWKQEDAKPIACEGFGISVAVAALTVRNTRHRILNENGITGSLPKEWSTLTNIASM